jgi:predicted unusual protein kinase regulating ubiquinone biosynthesis (AarF/ABC1/UbiB family)
MPLIDEAVQTERKIELLIKEWNLDKADEIKSILDYLDRIVIEFPLLLVENLKLIYKQSNWLERVNQSLLDTSKFSIQVIKDLIEDLVNDDLLSSFGKNVKCNETVQKTFNDLQELLSIATLWDDKAKSLINSK